MPPREIDVRTSQGRPNDDGMESLSRLMASFLPFNNSTNKQFNSFLPYSCQESYLYSCRFVDNDSISENFGWRESFSETRISPAGSLQSIPSSGSFQKIPAS